MPRLTAQEIERIRIYRPDIAEAVRIMREGGTILYPTDTIWGLGCDAANSDAVKRIYAIKKRTESKALIALVDSTRKVAAYATGVPDVAWDLMEMADKPTTLILDGARNLAPELIAPDGSIGIRVTEELFSRELCRQFNKAIVSTSANISGCAAPRCFAEIPQEIRAAVDYVCISRQEERTARAASSIIKISNSGVISIIRP